MNYQFRSEWKLTKVQLHYRAWSLTQRPLRVTFTGFSAGGSTGEVVVSETVFGCISEVIDMSFGVFSGLWTQCHICIRRNIILEAGLLRKWVCFRNLLLMTYERFVGCKSLTNPLVHCPDWLCIITGSPALRDLSCSFLACLFKFSSCFSCRHFILTNVFSSLTIWIGGQ